MGATPVTLVPATAGASLGNVGIDQSATTVQAKTTISVTNTYQQVAAADTTRKGGLLQYIAVAGTVGYVYFGASAPADLTTSHPLSHGQGIGPLPTDAIWVTATATDKFVASPKS